MNMKEALEDFTRTIEEASARLLSLTEDESRAPLADEKWSAKETIGHLIDSASNNHQRFVRAQFRDDLLFDGYEQDAWVALQQYKDAPWAELIELWRLFNLHIARIMQAAPIDERLRKRAQHNLDQIAWTSVSRDEPATLDYFMSDYVGHLKHHLAQIGIVS